MAIAGVCNVDYYLEKKLKAGFRNKGRRQGKQSRRIQRQSERQSRPALRKPSSAESKAMHSPMIFLMTMTKTIEKMIPSLPKGPRQHRVPSQPNRAVQRLNQHPNIPEQHQTKEMLRKATMIVMTGRCKPNRPQQSQQQNQWQSNQRNQLQRKQRNQCPNPSHRQCHQILSRLMPH